MTTGTFFSGHDRYYDRKKKDTVICLAGARSLLQPEKKDTVVCLAGARSLLRPEKKAQSSVWRVSYRYYNRKIKKFQSSVWRVGDRYYDRKKKVLVVCLAS
jgi:hypothetical protein